MSWLILGAVLAALVLAYIRAAGPAWAIVAGAFIIALLSMQTTPEGLAAPLLGLYVIVAGVLNFPALRRKFISDPLLAVYRRILPAMSQTEQEAIDAGTVWWDGELFSGRPDWNQLLEFPKPSLSVEEQAFLDNECEELCSMVEDEGRKSDDLPLLHWAMEDTLMRIQAAFEGVLANYPSRLLGTSPRLVIFPLGQWFAAPSDELGHRAARLLIAPSATRDRLTAGMHLPQSEAEVVGTLEAALHAAVEAEAVEAKIRAAAKSGALKAANAEDQADAALVAQLISAAEHAQLARFAVLHDKVIAVDHFPQDFGREEGAARQRAAA